MRVWAVYYKQIRKSERGTAAFARGALSAPQTRAATAAPGCPRGHGRVALLARARDPGARAPQPPWAPGRTLAKADPLDMLQPSHARARAAPDRPDMCVGGLLQTARASSADRVASSGLSLIFPAFPDHENER